MAFSSTPPPRPSITVQDVARAAGVSAMTVSRAINTPERVSAATVRKVNEALAKTGYVPNLLAGGLRSSRSRLVAAVVPTLTGPIYGGMVQSLTEALAAHGYQLILGQSGYDDVGEQGLLTALIGRRPDGIVLTGVTHSDAVRRKLAVAGIPLVETWDLTPTPIDMLVGFSHSDAGRSVCRYLHSRGRHHLAAIGAVDERSRRRMSAFCESAGEFGLERPAVHEVPAPTTLGSGRAAMRALRQSGKRIDGVFCSSDMLALGVLIEAQALGIRVPEQLAVVGFGDLAFAPDTEPALTSVRIDGTRIGQQAARYIVDRVAQRPIESPVTDIGFTIVERASS